MKRSSTAHALMPYERVLIATDFSEHAARAVDLARHIARASAAFRVVHVVDVPAGHDFMAPKLREQVEASRKRKLESARARLLEWSEAHNVGKGEVMILEGAVGRVVAQDANAWNADLLVIGARGHSRVVDLLLGSKARAVLQNAACDVLVGRGEGEGLRTLLLATDFYDPAKLAARRVAALADASGAELIALHVHDEDVWNVDHDLPSPTTAGSREWIEATLRDMLHEFATKTSPRKMRELVRFGRPAATIAKVAEAERASLVVVGTHGGERLERFLLGSVAESVVEKAPCSVLLVRQPAG